MLQQTQVATVIPYYLLFIAAFPTIASLAAATEEQVLSYWSGLGYYARGRNLHRAAQLIAEKYHSVFPVVYEQILDLPGIGRSTAAAICALAFHERRAILDGNVRRVLSRYCGIEGRGSETEKLLWLKSEMLLPASDIACYTQALMDLGCKVCTRSRAQCMDCPVHQSCIAWLNDRVQELPSPRPRKIIPLKNSTFLLLMHGNDILLEKRPARGIWGGLWCMPQFDNSAAALAWCAREGFMQDYPADLCTSNLASFTHTFSHFKLHITPLEVILSDKPLHTLATEHNWLDICEALNAAIPAPVRQLLEERR